MATAKKRAISPQEATDLELGGPRVFSPEIKKESPKTSSVQLELQRLKGIDPYRMLTGKGKRRKSSVRKTRRKLKRRH